MRIWRDELQVAQPKLCFAVDEVAEDLMVEFRRQRADNRRRQQWQMGRVAPAFRRQE